MKDTVREKRRIVFRYELDDNTVVAIKSRREGIIFLYPSAWDRKYMELSECGRMYLNSISREFAVTGNSITLDSEFNRHLGKGNVYSMRRPEGIVVHTNRQTQPAA